MKLLPLSLIAILFSSCGLVFGLFYRDWHSKTAFKSADSKRDYYIIEGVTQSHCGCSDLVAKNYKNKKLEFRLYYGGGLFAPEKYVYLRGKDRVDTQVYKLTTNTIFNTAFNSLDKEILHIMDSLALNRPPGSGLVYNVKRNQYTGYNRIK